MSWIQIVTKITRRTTFCTIRLWSIRNGITKTFRIWTYSYTKISTCWIVLEKFTTWWIKWTCWCTKMSVWITPIISTNTLLNTFVPRSKKRNHTSIRAISNTLHILIVFELTSRTSTVTSSICSIKVRLCWRTNCYTFFISFVVIQRSRYTT